MLELMCTGYTVLGFDFTFLYKTAIPYSPPIVPDTLPPDTLKVVPDTSSV